jgi:hypothetical protein
MKSGVEYGDHSDTLHAVSANGKDLTLTRQDVSSAGDTISATQTLLTTYAH